MAWDIQSTLERLNQQGLLKLLMNDYTTGAPILWGTDAYADLGDAYAKDAPMKPELICGKNGGILRPRYQKAKDAQSLRTRQHAEVFTPLFICKQMNDHADEVWFGRAAAFDGERVNFKRKSWRKYVQARRLEITCGEAPFLVSRYDAATGDAIAPEQRIGLLDRKLRVVNENAAEDWLKWAADAVKSIYGYEFQGDNLLIARLNVFLTWEEALEARLGRKPNKKESKAIARVIAANLWQMNGLTGMLPYVQPKEKAAQLMLDVDGAVPGGLIELEAPKDKDELLCQIKDWIGGEKKYEFLKVKGGKRAMKFDFIIGNPPYQEETKDTSDKPIYHLFMDGAYEISDKVELITPARFLFDAGKTPKAWNEKILSDPHLKVLDFIQNSSSIFPNTDIKGGIAITYRDALTEYGAIEHFTNFPELNCILSKVIHHDSFHSIMDSICLQNKFDLDALYRDFPDYRMRIGSNGTEKRLTTSIFEFNEIFTNEKSSEEQYCIIGLIKNKRYYRYISKKYIIRHENIDKYKVILPKSNGSGALGEVLSTPLIGEPLIGEPLIGYTQSFIGIGSFDTIEEANACFKYIKSKFSRCVLGVLKITQDNNPPTWKYVPLQDFTSQSDIDWSQSIPEIDQQLYRKYGLSPEEIAFIESHVKEMA